MTHDDYYDLERYETIMDETDVREVMADIEEDLAQEIDV